MFSQDTWISISSPKIKLRWGLRYWIRRINYNIKCRGSRMLISFMRRACNHRTESSGCMKEIRGQQVWRRMGPTGICRSRIFRRSLKLRRPQIKRPNCSRGLQGSTLVGCYWSRRSCRRVWLHSAESGRRSIRTEPRWLLHTSERWRTEV